MTRPPPCAGNNVIQRKELNTSPHLRGFVLALLALSLLLIGGCCSENSPVVQQQRVAAAAAAVAAAQPAPSAADAAQPAPPAARFFALQQTGAHAAGVRAVVVTEACVDGRGRNAAVKLDWSWTDPKIQRVRASIVEEGREKVWVENGPVWSETTGTWMQDGMAIRLQALPGGEVLGQVQLQALPCEAGQ